MHQLLIYWLFRSPHFQMMSQPLFSLMLQLSKSRTWNPTVFLVHTHIGLRTLRKSQRQGLDFRNLHGNMKSFQSMVPASWVVKVKNGRNIEKFLRPLSLMCVSMSDLLLWFFDWWFYFFFTRAIINLSGMRLLKSWMGFLMTFGQAKM